MTLQLGDIAPDFTADSTEGPLRFHEHLGDNWGRLFSHPATSHRCAPPELGEFARRKKEFDDRGTRLVGVSVDPVSAHRDWSSDIAEVGGAPFDFPPRG